MPKFFEMIKRMKELRSMDVKNAFHKYAGFDNV